MVPFKWFYGSIKIQINFVCWVLIEMETGIEALSGEQNSLAIEELKDLINYEFVTMVRKCHSTATQACFKTNKIPIIMEMLKIQAISVFEQSCTHASNSVHSNS